MSRTRIPSLILAVTLVSAACGRKGEEVSRLDTFPVRTVSVARQDLEDDISLVGSLKAHDEATLYSRIGGKLVENLVKEGDPVAKDQAVALVLRDEVGVKYEPAPVLSTLDGIVGRIYLDRGSDVTLNTPVALVVDARTVSARADVPERYAGKVTLGQEVRVEVEAYPGRVFKGKITRVSPVVDPTTRSGLIEVSLDNKEGRLHSGMFAKLVIVVSRKPGALVIPIAAVVDGTVPSAFVIVGGKAVKRDLKLGLTTDTQAEVLDGLKPGEQLVTFGLYGLKDGASVEVLPAQAPTAAGQGGAR